MTRKYYGTKCLTAIPMPRAAYNLYRGWDLPTDEDGADAGYLVEYQDGGKGNHPDHQGYISWSPAEQFEAAYQPIDAMSFGHAVVALKAGERVCRAGWNGKGMWLVYVAGTPQVTFREGSPYRAAGLVQADINAHIDMMTASGQMQPGWLASQSDMLADDWMIVPPIIEEQIAA